MNKNIFIYLLFMLVVLSAAVSVVSASEDITESAFLAVDESYSGDGGSLSLSGEESYGGYNDGTLGLSSEESYGGYNDGTLGLSNEEAIEDNNETLTLFNEGIIENSDGTLGLSNEDAIDSNNELLGFGDRVYTTTKGCDYVQLTNGYTAFCANRELTFPTTGTEYFTEQQYILTHNKIPGQRVDNKLRLAIVHYADNPVFQEKIYISAYAAGAYTRTQQLIWYLCNYDALAPYSLNYLEKDQLLKNAYYDIINRHNSGEWVNEDSMTYNNGTHEITYEFLAFRSPSSYQTLIGYKKFIKEIPIIIKNPSMDVNKKSLTPNVKAGEQTHFLITVWNTGDIDLGNVFVKEIMPADLEYADYTNKDIWRKNGDIFYYNNVLKVGESANFTIIFNTNKTGSFTNCVVAGSNETENKTTENKTTVYKPGMEVTKKSLTPNVKVGEQTLFLITVKNTGEVDLANVFVEEDMPDGLTYDSFTGDKWTKNGNVFNYNDILAVGQSASFTIAFNTSISGKFINCVVAGSNETEKKTSNNTTNVYKPDMEVTKKSLTPNVMAGEQTLFLITVKNTGEVDLANVFVEEDMPDGLTYDSFTGDKWTKNGNVFNYNDILAVGQSASFTIAFNTSIEGKFINCVVAGSNETEKKTSNNTTNVYKPGLYVEKITLTPVVLVGEQTKFEIVVRNTGNITLNNVYIEESSYDGLTFDHSEYQSHWIQNIVNGKHIWTLNTPLVVGEVAGLIVVFNTTKVGNFTNVAVAGSDETENKTAENTTKVVEPKFEVQKITITPTVLVGEQTTFEIVVRNTGDVDLTNLFIDEYFPAELIYDSYISRGYWTQSVVNGINRWTLIGNLAPNELMDLLITFNTTKVGNFTNVVVVGSDETENKTSKNTTEVVQGELDVKKITLTPTVLVGNQAKFEIVVKNTGIIQLHNVVLEETSYDGLIYDSFIDNGLWTYSVVNGKNVWTLNKVLNVNEIVNLFVNFNTVTVGNFTNIVTAGSDETKDKTAYNTTIVYNNTILTPEENPSKNPDISIEKIALNNVVVIGSQAVFEIIVTNTGDVVLNDVCVSEDSFTGLIYDSWYDNTGLWTKNKDLTWTMNSPLFLGEIASFYVVFNTTKTGEFTNIVSVDSNETDKKSANDTVEVIKPDFAVEKIAINRSVLVGEQVMFEIVVQNLGQIDLNNVVVREKSFNGLIYDSFIDHSGLWTKNNDLSWNLNVPLAVSEYAGFFVIFNTTTTGNFVNIITADSNEIPNKTANDTVEVLKADLDVQKITINRTVYVGEKVMFEILVHNAGKVILNDVTIRENSFDGLVYDSFIDYYNLWTKNSDLSWTLNTPLYAREYLSLFVVFNTDKVGSFTNVVSASSDKTQVKYANNITTVIDRPVPVVPDEPVVPEVPVVPDEPVIIEQPNIPEEPVPEKPTVQVNETPEKPAPVNKTSSTPEKSNVEVLPATGNPLVMVLLALFAVGFGVLRRKK